MGSLPLNYAHFEPFGSCDIKYLTLKTVFLLAFATTARRSEIHALSKEFARDDDWTYIKLKTVDDFLAKNQTVNVGAAAFQSFTVRAIPPTIGIGRVDDDALLCPVHAVKIY